ncbi:MAG: SRPBCC family protein [Mycobacteriales bacterium]|nr:MAG: cyclase [Pseudonocardiales bacterium]
MTDESTQSIDVEAAPEAIMDVIADFAAYPDWVSSVTVCEVQESLPSGRAHTVRFVLDAGVVKDDYVLRYDWSDDGLRVGWELVTGQMQRAQTGSYLLEPRTGATRVTYALAVDLAIPMLGMFKRKAEKVIMDTALRALKRRVET